MKWLLIIVFSGIAIFGIVKSKSNHTDAIVKSSSNSFAVLELFTSEGCSSCPPADRLLAQLANTDANIIPLSFHVDYWDQMGWKDPFSNSAFTERQQKYAKQFNLESIYTPELIINGEYELIGSNRSAAEKDIKKVFAENNQVQVNIADVKKENDKLVFATRLQGPIANSNIVCAVVQKHAESNVKAGENNGATLYHTNVVRTFIEQPANEKMNIEVAIPADIANDNWKLIVYTQQKDSLKITGAAIYNP
jgi:hypothetical protein